MIVNRNNYMRFKHLICFAIILLLCTFCFYQSKRLKETKWELKASYAVFSRIAYDKPQYYLDTLCKLQFEGKDAIVTHYELMID